MASKPALSQSWRGIISRALAKDFIIACCLRGTERSAERWRCAEISIWGRWEVSLDWLGWGLERRMKGKGLERGYLARSTSGDDVTVSDGALDYHYGVVETSFYFRDELFGSSS